MVPVAKVPSPKVLDDYRPVALTSLLMKGFERIVKRSLLVMTQGRIDLFQFAYLPNKGVEGATATLLDFVTGHLEGKKAHARLCFVDYSSAFTYAAPYSCSEIITIP